MQKLLKLFIVYTALMTTVVVVVAALYLQNSLKQSVSVESSLMALRDEIAKLSQNQSAADPPGSDAVLSTDSTANSTVPQGGAPAGLTVTALPTATGFVTLSDPKWAPATVYAERSYTAKVVGTLTVNQAYRWTAKQDSWYQITLADGTTSGWVSSRFVTALDSTTPNE